MDKLLDLGLDKDRKSLFAVEIGSRLSSGIEVLLGNLKQYLIEKGFTQDDIEKNNKNVRKLYKTILNTENCVIYGCQFEQGSQPEVIIYVTRMSSFIQVQRNVDKGINDEFRYGIGNSGGPFIDKSVTQFFSYKFKPFSKGW